MKMSKRILSSVLAILMVVSVCSVGFTVNAVDDPSESILDEIVLEPIARPQVEFYCTDITYVAAAANSLEPGSTIVKATPSGVPELSGSYAAQAYAGETPAATRVTFVTPTVGISITGFSCNNETVEMSALQYVAGGTYYADIISGTVTPNTDGTYPALIFTIDYTWTDGNTYQEKCVSYVEPVKNGGSYVEAQSEIQALAGTGSYYRLWASASTRLLGKGVYYEQPASIQTSASDPFRSYGLYNVATGTMTENVAAGYNTSLFADDKTDKPAGKMNQANEFTVPGTTLAHVYVDASAATTLTDINLRLDANVGQLSDRNNSNPYTALADAWVSAGSNVDNIVTTNDATAQASLGFAIPAKADYGVKQFEKNASMTTLTGGVGQYGHLYTNPFTGTVANLVDGSSYTITTKYYSYMWVEKGLLQHYNMTSSFTVPTSITFHIVDKSALREMIDYVLSTDPDTPAVRNAKKGVNPQAWYYSSGFSAYQSAYTDALNTLNNPQAQQTEIDAKTKALSNAYNSLSLKKADYTEVNALEKEAEAIKKNADAYPADDIALINEALNAVKTNYNILYQGAVDTMAKNLETAIRNAQPNPADYSKIDNAQLAFDALEESDYEPTSWKAVEDAFAAVVRGKSALEQDEVDAWADAIVVAMGKLVLIADLANWEDLDAAITEASLIDLSVYENGSAVTAAVKAANNAKAENATTPWPASRQSEVDGYAKAIRDAIAALKLKAADKSKLYAAINAEIPGNKGCYDQEILADYEALVVAGTIMYNNENLSIKDQDAINAKTAEITAKYEELMANETHAAADAVVENNVAPDCTTAGSYDTVVYCSVCGCELSRVTTTVDALGHTEGEAVIENEKDADCVNNGGYDTVVYCTVCGEEVSRESTVIDALGHTEGEAVIENEKAADCVNDGSYDTVVYCTVCGEEVSRETTVVDALGHTEGEAVVENEKAADCVNDGSYDTVVYCTVCGEEVSRETTVVDALGHTEGEWVVTKEAEVGVAGEETLYCTVCGEVIDTKEIPAILAYFVAEEGTTTVIDKDHGIIYGLSDEGLDDLEDYVEYEGGVVEYEYLGEYFGTGTVVNFVVDGEVYESYTVVIFGDLNGDGVVDTYDYAVLSAIINGDIEVEDGSALYLAADIFVDTAVDSFDLSVISAYVNGDAEITQTPEIEF